MERRRLKVRDFGGVVFWGSNLSLTYNVFGYGVGSSILTNIVKSWVGCET
jgi:hypothetical protein